MMLNSPIFRIFRSRNHVNTVRYLVDKGVDIDISDDDGFTPVHFAAQRGHVELLKILLMNLAADINKKVCYNCVYPRKHWNIGREKEM